MAATILIVDDEQSYLDQLQEILETEGYEVQTTTDGNHVIQIALDTKPDLIILDIIMPNVDGITVLKQLQGNPFLSEVPVMFLTAMGHSKDIANGLDLGAHEYLVKPFTGIELLARIRRLMKLFYGKKMIDSEPSNELILGDLCLNLKALELKIGDTVVELTSTEHSLLYNLIKADGTPVSIDALLQTTWQYPPGVGDPNLVRVHISNLRQKLKEYFDDKSIIQNIYGKGYLIKPN